MSHVCIVIFYLILCATIETHAKNSDSGSLKSILSLYKTNLQLYVLQPVSVHTYMVEQLEKSQVRLRPFTSVSNNGLMDKLSQILSVNSLKIKSEAASLYICVR